MSTYIVQGLTNASKQTNNVRLVDGEQLQLTLRYISNKWYISFSYNGFSVNGMRLILGNLCSQYQYAVPFSLIVFNTKDKGEPYFLEDFVSERIQLLIQVNE